MKELETTLTRKGQVTIPLAVRRAMGLQPHDKVRFEVEGKTAILHHAPSKVLASYGAVQPKHHPEDFKAIRDEFEQDVADEVAAEG